VSALALAATTACGSSSDNASGDSGNGSNGKTVSIGFIDSLTGALSFVGVEQQKAVKIAVQDLASQGITVDLTTKDDQSSAAGAVSGLQQLTQDSSIQGIVGEDSTDVGDAGLPLLGKDGRPTIYLQITQLPSRPSNVFSMAPATTTVAARVADYVYKTASAKRVAFIHQVQPTLDDAVTAFKSSASAAGVSVVSDQATDLTATSFGPQITNALSANPDVVGISALGPASGTIIAGLRSAGFKGLIFAQQAADSAATVQTAGKSVEGVLVGSYWDPAVDNAASKTFVDEFTKAYPSDPPPDAYAIEAYDAIRIMATSLVSANGDKAATVNGIQSGTFDGSMQEQIAFGSDGFAKLDGYVVQLGTSGNKIVG